MRARLNNFAKGPVGEWLQDRCFFHGIELIPEGCYRVCGECGHAWTEEKLLLAHNEILDEFDHPEVFDPDEVFSCPLCAHDW